MSPNLLCTRPDVYIKVGDMPGPGDQGACAVRCDCIGSWPSGGVENNRAPDVHSAECIERGTISVEPEALHNGFRYQVPTDVLRTRRRSTDTSPLACPRCNACRLPPAR